MRMVRLTLVLCLLLLAAGCPGAREARSPVDTLKDYVTAVRDKDTTQMKLLLSEETLKLHTEQAKAQRVTLDEIVQRETFFPPDQRIFAYRNEKIEGGKATVEVKNTFGSWDRIYLVNENGIWKIDKKGTAQEMIDQSERDVQKLEDQMEEDRKKFDEQLDLDDSAKDPLKEEGPTVDPRANANTSAEPKPDEPGSPPQTVPTKVP